MNKEQYYRSIITTHFKHNLDKNWLNDVYRRAKEEDKKLFLQVKREFMTQESIDTNDKK